MSNVSIELIKQLRAETHFGMTDCKKALEDANGDLVAAINILRSKGLRKLDTVIEAIEGEVRAVANGACGAIVEVNCQTDFAARSEPFQKFMNKLVPDGSFAPVAVTSGFVGWAPMPEVEQEQKALAAVLGESVQIRRVDRLSVPVPSEGAVVAYNHPGGRIAVLVSVVAAGALPTGGGEGMFAFGEHVAMHIAAANPDYVFREEIPADLVDKQKNFFRAELPSGKKPEQLEKILEGKMNRWFAENTLNEQQSLIDPSMTIAQAGAKAYSRVLEFRRFERGEKLK